MKYEVDTDGACFGYFDSLEEAKQCVLDSCEGDSTWFIAGMDDDENELYYIDSWQICKRWLESDEK